jgi:hypothetical protein
MTDISRDDAVTLLRPKVAEVMDIVDVTTGRSESYALRFRGRLRIDSVEAFDRLEPVFRQHDFTLVFRNAVDPRAPRTPRRPDSASDATRFLPAEEPGAPAGPPDRPDPHVILALPGVINPKPTNPRINLLLFLATLASAFYTGALYAYTGPCNDLARGLIEPLLTLWRGWPFAFSMLGILLAHEFGHYLMARRHGAPVTLPYFIPMPLSPFGTMGAVIALQAPIRNRRILLDIGVAGPLAGFVVAIPILFIGLAMAQVSTIVVPPGCGISLEGNSVLYLLSKYLVFGQLLPAPESDGAGGPALYWLRYFFTGGPLPLGGQDVFLNQVAWAGWAGLLVTGLNLIPAGQLDGGHTLFVLIGQRVRQVVPVILAVLIVLGFAWQGWWLWAVLIYFLNRRPAELLDEITPLDSRRRVLAVVTLILFLLVITPVPIVAIGG